MAARRLRLIRRRLRVGDTFLDVTARKWWPVCRALGASAMARRTLAAMLLLDRGFRANERRQAGSHSIRLAWRERSWMRLQRHFSVLPRTGGERGQCPCVGVRACVDAWVGRGDDECHNVPAYRVVDDEVAVVAELLGM